MTNLVSVDDIKRCEFNSLNLISEGVTQYLAYYYLVLGTASNYGLISEEEQHTIANTIAEAARIKANNKPIVIANNMYVLTYYLMAMDNLSKLERLKKATDVSAAEELLDEAGIKLLRQISYKAIDLRRAYEKRKTKNKNIVLTYEYYFRVLVHLRKFSSIDTKLNLKSLHNTGVIPAYSCHVQVYSESYIETIFKSIDNFLIELEILDKLNADDIMSNIHQSGLIESPKMVDSNKKVIDAMYAKIHELEEESKMAISEAIAQNEEYDEKYEAVEAKLLEEFKKLHPKMKKGIRFDYAFEEWMEKQDLGLDIQYVDIDALRESYNNKISDLVCRIDKLSNEESWEEPENWIGVEDFKISLELVLKIAAITIIMEEQPNINIPEKASEFLRMMDSIELKKAIEIVIADSRFDFSGKEIKYLRSI